MKQHMAGFTLIESLLAFALVLALALPLLVWSENSRHRDFSRTKRSEAVLMLQRIAEEFRAGILDEVQQALRKENVYNEVRYGFALLWEKGPATVAFAENVVVQRLEQVRLTLFWTDAEGKVNDLALYLAWAE